MESFMSNLNKYFIGFLSLLLIDLNFPQDWEFIGGPTGVATNNVIILNNNRILCSTEKGVFISDDLGDSWRISLSSQKFKGVYSITERKNGEILAIARFAIIKSTDSGESWSVISSMPNLSDYGADIKESPLDSMIYFAKNNTLYKSTDGGINWHVFWQGEIIDGFMINEKGWFYISERNKGILISKDNGNLFTRLSISIDFNYFIVYSLFSDKNDGFYFKTDYNNNSIVHYNRGRLTIIQSGWTNTPLGVTEIGDLIYKSGKCISLYQVSTKSSKNLSCPPFVVDQFARNISIKGNIWIANFSYLGLHLSDNGGYNWKSINNGLGFVEATAMHITNNGKFIISAFSGGFWGNLFSSSDEGTSWLQINPNLNPVFYDIDTLLNGNLVATGSYGIFTAKADGTNWVQRKNTEIASFVFVSKKGTAYAGCRPYGLLISRNNGSDWTVGNGINASYLSSFGESSNGRIFASSPAYLNGLYYSDDNGYTWKFNNALGYYGAYDFITVGDFILASTEGGIFRSEDNGESWLRLNYEAMKKFELAPNGDIIGVGIFSRDRIKISKDKGETWTSFASGLENRQIRDICFDPFNRFYALTDSGIFRNDFYVIPYTIYPEYGAKNLFKSVEFKWSEVPFAINYTLEISSDSLFTLLDKREIVNKNFAIVGSFLPDKTYFWRVIANSPKLGMLQTNTSKFTTNPPFSFSNNYPNPFNTNTTLEFYIPYNSHLKVEIYNSLGELIEKIIDSEFPEGKHKYFWDASMLSSGIYFIKIDYEGLRQIQKAVLIK